MKKQIKKLVPESILKLYRKISGKDPKYNSIFLGKPIEETFTEIYKTNHWGSNASISGAGSDNVQTETIVKELGPLLKKLEAVSLLDIPCGDFNWMQKVDLSGISYLGGDIVEELVLENQRKFGRDEKVGFARLNLLKDNLPKSDVLLVRDCLVHLSYADIFNALENIRSSGCTHLLTTTFPRHANHDIITGDWRTLNLCSPPFNFPKPILLINERCTEANGLYADKSLGLWRITDLMK